MRSFIFPAALVLCLASFTPAFTQSTSPVSGTIDDASGGVLPGVTVTATSNATGIVRTVLSNEAGAYNFASLTAGSVQGQRAVAWFSDQDLQ